MRASETSALFNVALGQALLFTQRTKTLSHDHGDSPYGGKVGLVNALIQPLPPVPRAFINWPVRISAVQEPQRTRQLPECLRIGIEQRRQ